MDQSVTLCEMACNVKLPQCVCVYVCVRACVCACARVRACLRACIYKNGQKKHKQIRCLLRKLGAF